MARVRTFLAVDVGPTIRAAAGALQTNLAKCGANVKWATAANLHVTLLFLGDVDDRELPAIFKAAKKAVAGEPPFTLRAAGVGAFPTTRRPKTLWAGLSDGATELARLHAALDPPLTALGCYRREDRAYTPHLTLGRVNADTDADLLAIELPKYLTWAGGHTTIEEVLIMSSEMTRGGPEYTTLGRCPLA